MHKVAALQPAAREQEPRGRYPVERIVVALESPVLRIEVLQASLRMELSMSKTNTVSPLRQRMIEDIAARCSAAAQLPATSCLGAFGRPSVQHADRLCLPASKNQHRCGHLGRGTVGRPIDLSQDCNRKAAQLTFRRPRSLFKGNVERAWEPPNVR
jgi:hypothetical protein